MTAAPSGSSGTTQRRRFAPNSSFADWAEEYGYDPDSRKAEASYRVTQKQTEKLRAFLGQQLFAQLVWDTERL